MYPPQDSGVIQSPNGEIQYFTKSIDIEANNVITEEIPNVIVVLYNKAIMVKCLCLLDFGLNLFSIAYTCYINMYITFVALISLMGYYSTNRYGLFLYLGYQYVKTVDKIIVLVSDDYDLYETMILVSFTACQIYITYFIQNFYSQSD